jgi:ElaA protein
VQFANCEIAVKNFPIPQLKNFKITMITWECKKFDDLSPAELYAILQLRNEVFIIEQQCIYQDLDNIDQAAWHLMGWETNKLVAYTRLIQPGVSYDEASIGRVVTSPSARRRGLGKELMKRSLLEIKKIFDDVPVRIGAQLYLKDFYSALGFIQKSEVYLEDGIEHIKMVKLPSRRIT